MHGDLSGDFLKFHLWKLILNLKYFLLQNMLSHDVSRDLLNLFMSADNVIVFYFEKGVFTKNVIKGGNLIKSHPLFIKFQSSNNFAYLLNFYSLARSMTSMVVK